MTSTPTRKVFRVLIFFYGITFFVFFLYSIYLYSQSSLIKPFMWGFLFLKASALFIKTMLPLSVSGALLTYSLFFKVRDIYDKNGVPRPFNQLVVSPVIFFVVLTVIYTVLSVGFLPVILRNLEDKQYLSRLAGDFRKKWEEKLKAKDYGEALKYMKFYLAIDKNNKEVRTKYSDLRLKVMTVGDAERRESSKRAKDKENSNELGEGFELGESAINYLELAHKFFKEEDYFSAHYYASLAFDIDKGLTEAKRLMSKSWDKISAIAKGGSYYLSEAEKKKQELYSKKKDGYKNFLEGNYVESYYIFNDLNKEYPDDPDVRVYLAKVKEKLAGVAFFKDEIEEVINLPGYRDILFVNGNRGADREIVYIGKIIPVVNDIYMENIEAICVNVTGGRVKYHFFAPYGKLVDKTILLKCLDRDNSKNVVCANYIEGKRENAIKDILKIEPTVSQLKELRADYRNLEGMYLAGLWGVREEVEKFGLIERYVDIAILVKLVDPFSFLILSLFGISFGWFFRARYISNPPFFSYLFIPFLPVMVAFFVMMYRYAIKIFLLFLVLVAGFWTALTVMLIAQALLLFFAIVTVAGQKVE